MINFLFKIKSRKQKLDQNKGFTLVELSVYMGLLMIMIVVLTEIFTSIIENQLSSENTSNVNTDGRFIYTRFIYDVNRADEIITPQDLGSSSGTLELDINGQNHTYSLDGTNLVLTDSTGENLLNGNGTSVSDLLFTKIGNDDGKHTVRINFTIRGNTERGGFEEKEFQTTAGLR